MNALRALVAELREALEDSPPFASSAAQAIAHVRAGGIAMVRTYTKATMIDAKALKRFEKAGLEILRDVPHKPGYIEIRRGKNWDTLFPGQLRLGTWKKQEEAAEPKPAGAETIGVAAVAHAATLRSSVKVTQSQGNIYFSITGDKDLKELSSVKKQVGDWLMHKYPERKFTHAVNRGKKVWWWLLGSHPEGLRMGINIKLTPEEVDAVMEGPWKWKTVAQ